MPTINDIISHVESMTRHAVNRDEGAHFGPTERDITGANDPSICCRFGK